MGLEPAKPASAPTAARAESVEDEASVCQVANLVSCRVKSLCD